MTFGIELINDNGVIQVASEDGNNYREWARGSANAGKSNVFVTASIDATETYPLLFCRPHNDGDYIGGCFLTPLHGQWFFSLYCEGPFDWRVYNYNSSSLIDSSTYGMQVFDASGNVIFDSRAAVPQVQTIIHLVTSTQHPTVPITKTYTGWGVRPWVALNYINWGIDVSGGLSASWGVQIDPSAPTSSLIFSSGAFDQTTGAFTQYSSSGSPGFSQKFMGGEMFVPIGICY